MAFEIKYHPEDLTRNYGTLGIKFPMNGSGESSATGLFNMSYTTEEQAVSNYVNLLLTRRGERYMQPTYGVGLQTKIFEQNTNALQFEIEQDIREQSQYWLPYIFNHDIQVDFGGNIPSLSGNNEHGIQISITFSVTENGANRTIQIYNLDSITRVEVF